MGCRQTVQIQKRGDADASRAKSGSVALPPPTPPFPPRGGREQQLRLGKRNPTTDAIPLCLLALSLANLLTFSLFAIDKARARARAGGRRIPERVLLLAALFGALGAWLGQRLLRHKTRKQPFAAWLDLSLTLHVSAMLTAAAMIWRG